MLAFLIEAKKDLRNSYLLSYENAFFDVLVVRNSLTGYGDRYVVYGQKPKVEGLEETVESNSSSSPVHQLQVIRQRETQDGKHQSAQDLLSQSFKN
jgi:hypothetical protein